MIGCWPGNSFGWASSLGVESSACYGSGLFAAMSFGDATVTEYSNRALAERLGWHIHEHPTTGKRYLHTPEHFSEDCGDYQEWCSTQDAENDEERWEFYCPYFKTDPTAMVALMERLRAMGYVVIGNWHPGKPAWAAVCRWNPTLTWGESKADSPMAALAHAAWKALGDDQDG